ncbi:HIT-like domain-containing protein [Cladorrhinum sp. PSN259]|nr:HIT-like domain-containing protein [Cladorrhinum sp. PSN259]
MLAPVTRTHWCKPSILSLPSLISFNTAIRRHHHYNRLQLHRRQLPLLNVRKMSSTTPKTNSNTVPSSSGKPRSEKTEKIFFGPFEVTSQVFLTTPHSFALVNLKPLLPGHVLVCPRAPHRRLTSLSRTELTDLWTTVQRVQRMLAYHYFSLTSPASPAPPTEGDIEKGGSFNLALQDGPESGQTVGHVHVHVIPRIKGSTEKSVETPSDELYERMAREDGNVGGALWDRAHEGELEGKRPKAGGSFPSIEDAERRARTMEEMEEEAGAYRRVLELLEGK